MKQLQKLILNRWGKMNPNLESIFKNLITLFGKACWKTAKNFFIINEVSLFLSEPLETRSKILNRCVRYSWLPSKQDNFSEFKEYYSNKNQWTKTEKVHQTASYRMTPKDKTIYPQHFVGGVTGSLYYVKIEQSKEPQ